MQREFLIGEEKGYYPYMVCWTSLDGRPRILTYETFHEAEQQRKHLIALGRQPSVWLRIDEQSGHGAKLIYQDSQDVE